MSLARECGVLQTPQYTKTLLPMEKSFSVQALQGAFVRESQVELKRLLLTD